MLLIPDCTSYQAIDKNAQVNVTEVVASHEVPGEASSSPHETSFRTTRYGE